jgi:hypothetical protein
MPGALLIFEDPVFDDGHPAARHSLIIHDVEAHTAFIGAVAIYIQDVGAILELAQHLRFYKGLAGVGYLLAKDAVCLCGVSHRFMQLQRQMPAADDDVCLFLCDYRSGQEIGGFLDDVSGHGAELLLFKEFKAGTGSTHVSRPGPGLDVPAIGRNHAHQGQGIIHHAVAIAPLGIGVILFLAFKLSHYIGMHDLALRNNGLSQLAQIVQFFLFGHGEGINPRCMDVLPAGSRQSRERELFFLKQGSVNGVALGFGNGTRDGCI